MGKTLGKCNCCGNYPERISCKSTGRNEMQPCVQIADIEGLKARYVKHINKTQILFLLLKFKKEYYT